MSRGLHQSSTVKTRAVEMVGIPAEIVPAQTSGLVDIGEYGTAKRRAKTRKSKGKNFELEANWNRKNRRKGPRLLQDTVRHNGQLSGRALFRRERIETRQQGQAHDFCRGIRHESWYPCIHSSDSWPLKVLGRVPSFEAVCRYEAVNRQGRAAARNSIPETEVAVPRTQHPRISNAHACRTSVGSDASR